MDFDDDAADAAYRAELRAWLGANSRGDAPADPEGAFAFRRQWQATMAEAGWAAPAWPAEWGGRDATVAQTLIFQDELVRAGVPVIVNSIGVWNIGPAILQFGTEAQKRRWLPDMLSARHIWCQGFSEPGAGSDLAALSTRAVREGDFYVLDGQKTWISFAHRADRCFVLCRTDPDAAKHAGLSLLVVEMAADGVSCRPLREATGDVTFGEVFFSGVRVPVADRVGDENDGWRIATTTLTHERVGTATYGMQLRRRLEGLLARPEVWTDDPVRARVAAQQIGSLWTEVEVIRLVALRAVTKAARGEAPWPEVPIGKLLWSRTAQDLAEAAMGALGPDGLRWRDDPSAPDAGAWAFEGIWSRMTTIGAGTTEVQKNILAERALGLPRG